MSFRVTTPPARAAYGLVLLSALCTWTACHDSNNPAPPPIGIADEPTVDTFGALPGVVVTIDKLSSRRGEDKAAVGDVLTIEFSVATEAGAPLELATMARGGAMVSGPTFNYQRVIASQGDVIDKAVKIALGKYRYTFSEPIPAKYIAPLNDTDDLTEGELTGQDLLSGTYTVGLELRKDYTVNGVTYRDPGNAAKDFLVGDATTIEPRQVVTLQNCNQCHGELRAHGDNRNNLVNCLLCHTAGAEDKNVADAADGTPGVAIDFKVMIHKIHAGYTLPSVQGVTTNPDGTRDYSATPKPYEIVGYGNTVHDFSEVAFPSWPAFTVAMPADLNTSGSQESNMRKGPVDCAKCHGDPDGDGPLAAPAQGDLAYTQPSIQACGSCHDDWKPEYPYNSNGLTMPLQRDNAACKDCHRQSGEALDVVDAHRHPLTDPDFAHGVIVDIQDVVDVPMVGVGNGKFDEGERVQVTMTIKDRDGNDIALSGLYRLEVLLNGPTTNPNFMHSFRLPLDASIGAGPVYTFNVPQLVFYEPSSVLADAGQAEQNFPTGRAPLWNASTATSVMVRTGIANSTTLVDGCTVNQNYLDVADSTGFAKNDFVVIEDADLGRREYLKIQWVDGNRLWFSNPYTTTYAPNTRFAHVAGSTVDEIVKTDIPSANYTVDAVNGTIIESALNDFGDGEVLISYTGDYMVPATYPGPIYDTPDLDQTWGDWVGLAVLPGTYNLSIQASKTEVFTVAVGGDTTDTTYRDTSVPAVAHLLFGSAETIELVNRINDSSGCYNCHTDIAFHGGSRRGIETCLMCHGAAGGEDRPQYVNNSAERTPEFTIDFRNLIHELHGEAFPYMPGQVQNCAACHGENNNAWVEPAPRNHPDATFATRSWKVACVSCHTSDAEKAHMDVNTNAFGNEACAICHGIGEDKDLRTVHTVK